MSILPILTLGSTGRYVQLLQMGLDGLALNYNGFAIDGVLDIRTRDALLNFKDRFDLPHVGVVDSVTWKILIENVKAVQKLLNSNGYHSGYPDGWFGPTTTAAVKKFQTDNQLYPSGIVDPRTRQRLFNPHPKDHYEYLPSSNALRSLNPHVASMATRFLELTRANQLDVHIYAAFRSWDEEDRLFAQGRWTPGNIVTNARGGDSYHNWGLAFDAAPYENGMISNDVEKFKRMGQLGLQVGLEWGGNFKSIVDYPHFQFTFGLNTWDLLNGVRPPA
ncbi:peptidoglycan-binding protein [Fodinisporobacter ferrooxydans]|uniref:Peptidoglycan-binding protein n=1 Tax=Fodinisporobacter ferrooxydans TaxID=2901836 RepID=A0ABY4CME9_9BACL|nr:peptidoglycan-binding protein [Alicyclobacillaceae bacterium MYW30-H2]